MIRSDATGSYESFMEFMLEVIREAILPYAWPESVVDTERVRVLIFFRNDTRSTIVQLVQHPGYSKWSVECIVTQLEEEGMFER